MLKLYYTKLGKQHIYIHAKHHIGPHTHTSIQPHTHTHIPTTIRLITLKNIFYYNYLFTLIFDYIL